MYEFESIIAASGSSPVTPAPYEGEPDDLSYLRSYLIAGMTSRYQVDASIFDRPTLTSTSLIRDYISHLVFDQANLAYGELPPELRQVAPLDDVAVLIREGVAEQCGFVNLQLQHAYRSFGFESTRIEAINGTVDNFTVGHVTTEVYIVDYDKAVIQDAYLNFMLRDAAEEPLSHQEVRVACLEGQAVEFVQAHPSIYDYQQTDPAVILPIDQAAVLASTLVPYGWLTGISSLAGGGITGALWKPGSTLDPDLVHLASDADVQSLIQPLADGTRTWQATFTQLQDLGHDVRAFAFVDPHSSVTLSEWITFRLQDGSRVSVRFDGTSFELVPGGYDEIMVAMANGSLTPSADLASQFVLPPLFLGSDGLYQWHWEAASHVQSLDFTPQLAQTTGLADGSVTSLLSLLTFVDSAGDSPVYVQLLDQANDGMRILRPDGSYLGVDESLTLRYSELAGYQVETGGTGDALLLRVSNSLAWSEPMFVYQATRNYFNGSGEQVVELRDNAVRLTERETTHTDGSRTLEQWDVAAAHPWSALREEFDNAGHLLAQRQQFDDNRVTLVNWTYDAGVLVNTQTRTYDASGHALEDTHNAANGSTYRGVWDNAGVFDWAFTEESRNTSGALVSQRVVSDNGSSVLTYLDADSSQSWTSEEARYLANGDLSSKEVRNDDGSLYRADWNTTHTGSWSFREQVRDAANILVTEKTTNNDGSSYAALHDVTSSFSWTLFETVYALPGVLASQKVTNDDGSSYRSTWDIAQMETWSQREQNRDASGVLLSEKVSYDSGAYYLATFDTTGSASWASRETMWTTAGATTSLKVTNDDGSVYRSSWDTDGLANWSQREQNRDSSGQLVSDKTSFDDGSTYQATYGSTVREEIRSASGQLSALQVTAADGSSYSANWDIGNNLSRSLYEQSRDAGQRLLSEKTSFDDGSSHQATYDVSGTASWAVQEAVRTATGNLASQKFTNDDGSSYQATWDTESTASWSQREQSRNMAGQLTAEKTTNDDGSTFKSQWDPEGDFAWSLRESSTDASGALSAERVVADDGSTYQAIYDTTGTQSWAMQELSTTASGQVSAESTTFDDGSKWLKLSDVLDTSPWASIERALDTLGRTTDETVTADSGSWVARQYDAANLADWAMVESSYDATGRLLSQRTYRDGEMP
jgi:hypothetical protein